MRNETLADEARKCRNLAQRYDGRPEQPFLLKAAVAFDELAREERNTPALMSAAGKSQTLR